MYQGLFQGPTQNDVNQTLRQERDLRVRQAQVDNQAGGGNYYSGLVAKAAQQQAEAFGGLAGAAGKAFGSDMLEDPRLAKARKRDTDKNAIVAILAKYSDPASDGGKQVTEKEMKIGFSELMSRGYVQEAKDFLAMAQSMGGQRIDEINALSALQKAQNAGKTGNLSKFKGDLYKAKDGGIWREVGTTDASTNWEKVGGAEGSSNTYNPEGAEFLKDGMTRKELIKQQADLVEAKVWAEQRPALRASVKTQRIGLNMATKALKLLPKIKTGGFSVIEKSITDFFGITDKNVGQFNNLTGQVLINKIGEFGANPTEGERRFLEKVEAGLSQSKPVNEAILKEIIRIYERSLNRTSKYLGMNFREANEAKSKESKEMSDKAKALIDSWDTTSSASTATPVVPLPPLANRVAGQIYQSPSGPKKWTGTGWVTP